MRREGECRQRVVIALEPYGLGITYLADRLDARSRLADAESLSGENLLVAEGVELGKALAEFELLAVDAERTVGALLALNGVGREAVGVDAEEVTHAGLLEAQVARHAVEAHHVHYVFLDGAEYPLQHIVEVHSDVGSNAAALVHVALPRSVVPLAAGGDVGEVDVVHLVGGTFVNLLFERLDAVVEPELQDVVGLVAGLLLHLLEGVDIVWIEHHGLLAYDVAAQHEAVTDEGVVRIVGRTHTHPVQRFRGLHLLGAEAVEELVLGKERTLGEETVQPSHAVELIICGKQRVAGILYGFKVSGGNVARRTYEGKVCHGLFFFYFFFCDGGVFFAI